MPYTFNYIFSQKEKQIHRDSKIKTRKDFYLLFLLCRIKMSLNGYRRKIIKSKQLKKISCDKTFSLQHFQHRKCVFFGCSVLVQNLVENLLRFSLTLKNTAGPQYESAHLKMCIICIAIVSYPDYLIKKRHGRSVDLLIMHTHTQRDRERKNRKK